MPEWHGETPDLSECRSVWLNSLEARVREGESLLSISNDLAQVRLMGKIQYLSSTPSSLVYVKEL